MARTVLTGIDPSTQSYTVVLRQLAEGKAAEAARIPCTLATAHRTEPDPAFWWDALIALKQFQSQPLHVRESTVSPGKIGIARLQTT